MTDTRGRRAGKASYRWMIKSLRNFACFLFLLIMAVTTLVVTISFMFSGLWWVVFPALVVWGLTVLLVSRIAQS